MSGIGAYCSPYLLHEENRRFLQERPVAFTEKIENKKGEWVEVKGTFVADGGEQFIVVGVYPYVGFDTQRMIVDYDNQYAYYYLDGISLKEVEPVMSDQRPVNILNDVPLPVPDEQGDFPAVMERRRRAWGPPPLFGSNFSTAASAPLPLPLHQGCPGREQSPGRA